MVTTPSPPRSSCPINFGLEIFGDQWTLLVLRDVLIQHKQTFREFLSSDERIASNILADRLKRLEACGLVTRSASPNDGRVSIYAPTDAARDLIPVLVEMSYWGASHHLATGAPASFKAAYNANRTGLIASIRAGEDPSRSG